jgi:hypothetical protein
MKQPETAEPADEFTPERIAIVRLCAASWTFSPDEICAMLDVIERRETELERLRTISPSAPMLGCSRCGKPHGTPGLGTCWYEPSCSVEEERRQLRARIAELEFERRQA